MSLRLCIWRSPLHNLWSVCCRAAQSKQQEGEGERLTVVVDPAWSSETQICDLHSEYRPGDYWETSPKSQVQCLETQGTILRKLPLKLLYKRIYCFLFIGPHTITKAKAA